MAAWSGTILPWNNNIAERAIPTFFAIQRNISGTFYSTFVAPYLRPLCVAQSCRSKGSHFLHSCYRAKVDIAEFKARKRPQISAPVSRKTSEDLSEDTAYLRNSGV